MLSNGAGRTVWDEWLRTGDNPWDDPGFRVSFNGEGSLFYPGDKGGIEGPVASIRLKNLRDGMEDYEYFRLSGNLSGNRIVYGIVRTAVPSWGDWDANPYHILELRRQLAQEILKRRNPESD